MTTPPTDTAGALMPFLLGADLNDYPICPAQAWRCGAAWLENLDDRGNKHLHHCGYPSNDPHPAEHCCGSCAASWVEVTS